MCLELAAGALVCGGAQSAPEGQLAPHSCWCWLRACWCAYEERRTAVPERCCRCAVQPQCVTPLVPASTCDRQQVSGQGPAARDGGAHARLVMCVKYTRGCLAVHCWDTYRVPDAAVRLLCCSLVLSLHGSLSAGHWTCAVECGWVNRARPVLCVCPVSRTGCVSAHDNCSSFGCSGMLRAVTASVAAHSGLCKAGPASG